MSEEKENRELKNPEDIETTEVKIELSEDYFIEKKYSRSSLYKDAWKRLRRNKLAMFGIAIVIFVIIIAIFSPLIAPYDPIERIKEDSLLGPSKTHLFGTDILSRPEHLLSIFIFLFGFLHVSNTEVHYLDGLVVGDHHIL